MSKDIEDKVDPYGQPIKDTNMFWWLSPRRDEHYQWWWGYQKVRMVVLPQNEKDKYLKRMNSFSE